MSDILSNEEISALIGAYRSAEGNGRAPKDGAQVRLYDFSRPDKFSREHLRTLNSIHTKYGTTFASALSGMLHAPTQADLLSVDQVAYREYTASVPENTLFCNVSLDPLTTTAIFEFNPSIVAACIDGLTGGSAISHSQETELTDIDRAIMQKVVDQLLKKYEEAWSSYFHITARAQHAEVRGSSKQIFLPGEPVLICAYEVKVAQSVGMMSICIPAGAVEAILPHLAVGRTVSAAGKQSPAVTEALHENLKGVDMECKAILGRTTLTMADIVNLHEGDIITLDAKANSEIEFWVGGTKTCLAVPGRSGRRLGLRITRLVKDMPYI